MISPFLPPPKKPNFFLVFPAGCTVKAGETALASSSSSSFDAVPSALNLGLLLLPGVAELGGDKLSQVRALALEVDLIISELKCLKLGDKDEEEDVLVIFDEAFCAMASRSTTSSRRLAASEDDEGVR